MSLLFFDMKFIGLHKSPISLGIVADNGKKFYAEFTDYNKSKENDLTDENIIRSLRLNPIPWHTEVKERLRNMEKDGYVFAKAPEMPTYNSFFTYPYKRYDESGNIECVGSFGWIHNTLKEYIAQFDFIQFISDISHYDFILLISLLTNNGIDMDVINNISTLCHDINSDIAKHYGISDKEAFDKSREEIVSELCENEIEGMKHNALYDAEVIKTIWEEVC